MKKNEKRTREAELVFVGTHQIELEEAVKKGLIKITKKEVRKNESVNLQD